MRIVAARALLLRETSFRGASKNLCALASHALHEAVPLRLPLTES